MAGRRGILVDGYLAYIEVRLVLKRVNQAGRAAQAPPVVIPQGRQQPRVIGREQQLRKGATPARGVATPRERLFGAGLDEDVGPIRVQLDPRRVEKITSALPVSRYPNHQG